MLLTRTAASLPDEVVSYEIDNPIEQPVEVVEIEPLIESGRDIKKLYYELAAEP